MTRVLRAAIAAVLAALIFAAVAVAAIPVSNGVYEDGAHGILIGLKGQFLIHGFDMKCHGKTWVARALIGIHADGTFSYTGTGRLAKNGHPTATSTSMSLRGAFKTSQHVTGRAAVGGCHTSYSAFLI
jgi:hypothetical protein